MRWMAWFLAGARSEVAAVGDGLSVPRVAVGVLLALARMCRNMLRILPAIHTLDHETGHLSTSPRIYVRLNDVSCAATCAQRSQHCGFNRRGSRITRQHEFLDL